MRAHSFQKALAVLALLVCTLGCLAATSPSLDVSAAVTCPAPGTVFLDTEILSFQFAAIADYAPVHYEIRDFRGDVVQSGIWPSDGTLRPGAFPCGYYVIRLQSERGELSGGRSFLVLSDRGETVPNPESPFALDVALSWHAQADPRNARCPGETFDLTIELLRRIGVGNIRERLSWPDVESPRGSYHWKQYLSNADKLSARGIDVLGLTHLSPPWAQETPGGREFPDDLLEVYRFSKALATTFHGRAHAWEFWNEPDHFSGTEKPWEVAAVQKAAALGFRAGDPDIVLLQPSFCIFPLGPFADLAMRNGMGNYFDVFNFHSYRPFSRYPEIADGLRETLKAHGMSNKPIYMTEVGSQAEGFSEDDCYYPGMKESSPRQDRLLTEFFPKSQILMLANGIRRTFSFVLLPVNEVNGTKAWGMLRRDFTAKPQLGAFAVLVRELDRATYLGEYDLGTSSRAFLFRQPDGSQTLVAWRESVLDTASGDGVALEAVVRDTTFDLPLQGSLACVDVLGKVTFHRADALPLSRYPGYIRGVDGLVPTKPALAKVDIAPPHAFSDAEAVVFKPVFSEGFGLSSDRCCVLDIDEPGGEIRLEVYNLANKPQTGRIRISGLANLQGLPETVALAPMSRTEILLRGEPDGAVSELSIEGIFNGAAVSPAVVPLRSMAALENAPALALNSPSRRWSSNASGVMEIADDPAENAVRFRTRFPPGTPRWTYPVMELQLPKESFENATALRFQIKGSGKKCPGNLMLVAPSEDGTDSQYETLGAGEVTSEWRTVTILLPQTPVQKIRIGANPEEDDYQFWIRNLEIVK